MKKITRGEAVALIEDQKAKGKLFGVKNRLRTTGEIREGVYHGNVTKYTTGQGLRFDPASKGLIVVWEANNAEGAKGADAYRMLAIEGLLEVKAEGEVFEVVEAL